eukprot:CAMPEP_0119335688 /NCGR_PEP_ID=MMETSP1333-20130426/90080_1 /TAXON_ID=418940 /ORGANISM="Scyphosphaera apsteinii, Strain RCC1455" /LENGTH=174 /DNA_ID=CAMNT_0007346297 /DNA_START=50 /DNA_END=575 /DNA_ORIENTATION=+
MDWYYVAGVSNGIPSAPPHAARYIQGSDDEQQLKTPRRTPFLAPMTSQAPTGKVCYIPRGQGIETGGFNSMRPRTSFLTRSGRLLTGSQTARESLQTPHTVSSACYLKTPVKVPIQEIQGRPGLTTNLRVTWASISTASSITGFCSMATTDFDDVTDVVWSSIAVAGGTVELGK